MKVVIFVLLTLLGVNAVEAAWQDKITQAALDYAESKKSELVAESNKKAIVALYKKLYPQLKNKSEKEALRALGELGLNASKINAIAADLASGNAEKVRSASESLGVEVGQRLSKNLNDPYLREKMQGLLGGVDEVRNISQVLGEASAGDNKALYEYAATAFINAAGGGGVMSFYSTAHGVMKFAKDAYMDSSLEELYQQYKSGKLSKEGLELQMDLGGYHTVIRDKMIEERKNKLASLGNVDISPELRDHLTAVSEDEIRKQIIAGFKGRMAKEENDAKEQVRLKEIAGNTQVILEKLNDIAYQKYGKNWLEQKDYNLGKFVDIIYAKTEANPNLDPRNPNDLKLMSALLSTRMVYGKDSSEYLESLKSFNEIMAIRQGSGEKGEGSTSILAGSIKGSWSGVSNDKYHFKAKGGFSFTLSPTGQINGSYWGDDHGKLSGTINASGDMSVMSGGGSAGTAKWSGALRRDERGNLVGRGQWHSKGWNGSWSGAGN